MGIFQRINNAIKRFIIKRASKHKTVDIVEVRTKQISLLSVFTETDLCLKNTFFLPYTLISIQTDLLNRDGLKVGKMNYDKPTIVKGNSELVLTSSSEISIITSVFNVISNLLSQPIWMRSVGIATIKFLWFTVELPVDDVFEIHPSKLKILKEETEEERILRLQKEEERRAQRAIREAEKNEQRLIREAEKKELRAIKSEERKEKIIERKDKQKERRDAYKEKLLKRKYKDKYIPKDVRHADKATIENSAIESETEDLRIEIDAAAIENITIVEQTLPEQNILSENVSKTIASEKYKAIVEEIITDKTPKNTI